MKLAAVVIISSSVSDTINIHMSRVMDLGRMQMFVHHIMNAYEFICFSQYKCTLKLGSKFLLKGKVT